MIIILYFSLFVPCPFLFLFITFFITSFLFFQFLLFILSSSLVILCLISFHLFSFSFSLYFSLPLSLFLSSFDVFFFFSQFFSLPLLPWRYLERHRWLRKSPIRTCSDSFLDCPAWLVSTVKRKNKEEQGEDRMQQKEERDRQRWVEYMILK